MMRSSCAMALMFALSLALSSEGFRLKRKAREMEAMEEEHAVRVKRTQIQQLDQQTSSSVGGASVSGGKPKTKVIVYGAGGNQEWQRKNGEIVNPGDTELTLNKGGVAILADMCRVDLLMKDEYRCLNGRRKGGKKKRYIGSWSTIKLRPEDYGIGERYKVKLTKGTSSLWTKAGWGKPRRFFLSPPISFEVLVQQGSIYIDQMTGEEKDRIQLQSYYLDDESP